MPQRDGLLRRPTRVIQPNSLPETEQVLKMDGFSGIRRLFALRITVPALCLPAGITISYKYLFFAYPHLIRLLLDIDFGCPLACPLCDRI
jgi:hypothetical protein